MNADSMTRHISEEYFSAGTVQPRLRSENSTVQGIKTLFERKKADFFQKIT